MTRSFFRRARLPSLKHTCVGLLILLLSLAGIWMVGFTREILAFRHEVAYFEELDRLENLDNIYQSLSQIGLSEIAESLHRGMIA
jgi:uncharacterized membrane protein